MLPYKTLVNIDNQVRTPIYLQISNELIKHISSGVIKPGTKLPGARLLCEILSINRRTVMAAYDELSAQGWITINPNKGCFVKDQLPDPKPRSLSGLEPTKQKEEVFFDLDPIIPENATIKFDQSVDDGYPDVRLAPLKGLAKNYAYIMNSSMAAQLMNYKQKYIGDEILRNELAKYLSETRSIHVEIDNIMTTRGSLMAFYVLFKTILTPANNEVIVAYPGYNEGHETIRLAGGRLNYVGVDEEGMIIDQVEMICKKKSIRAVFIIPHHHYPTTVSLSAQRRMQLLALAEKYRFAIIEDDYDYDFHYSSAPILPIASIDNQGSVAYVGSFSKTVAPALRLGFVVAPKQLINAASQVSKQIDSFGNTALEHSVAMLFQEGLVRRHLRKVLKEYHDRRDHFCSLLGSELGDYFDFTIPEGGLAVWTKLKKHDLETLHSLCNRNHIKIPNGSSYFSKPFEENMLRFGFASMTKAEAASLISSIKKALNA